MKDQVAVTAHRGSSRRAPENTLSALRRAIEDGADYAEIDVQGTSDGTVVLFHDTDLMRVAGDRRKVWEITSDEIKTLDAGRWFSPDYKGERIPTLADAIEMARGKIKLNIELKFSGNDERLVERTVDIVRAQGFESQCVISSFRYEGILKVRELAPELRVGYIVAKAGAELSRPEANFLSLNWPIVSRDVVETVRRQGKGVHVWTVNDPNRMSVLIDWGVENIITDVPDRLVSLLKKRVPRTDLASR